MEELNLMQKPHLFRWYEKLNSSHTLVKSLPSFWFWWFWFFWAAFVDRKGTKKKPSLNQILFCIQDLYILLLLRGLFFPSKSSSCFLLAGSPFHICTSYRLSGASCSAMNGFNSFIKHKSFLLLLSQETLVQQYKYLNQDLSSIPFKAHYFLVVLLEWQGRKETGDSCKHYLRRY